MDDLEKAGPGHGARAVAVRTKLRPKADGTVHAKLAVLRHGRTNVETEMTLARRDGWHVYPADPSLTVNTPLGALRVAAPRARTRPKVTRQRDGSVLVDLSLFNRAGVDISVSVLLRHRDGWWFTPERPEVTVRPGQRADRVSCRFRPVLEHGFGHGDEVTVQVQMNGVPVAEATTTVRAKGLAARRLKPARLSALALTVPVVLSLTGLAVLVDRSFEDVTRASRASATLLLPPGEQATGGQAAATGGGGHQGQGGGIPVTGTDPESPVTPVPPVTPVTPTVVTPPVTPAACPLSSVTDILAGLPPLPILGSLGSLLDLDSLDCLAIIDLQKCLSSVSGSIGTRGALLGGASQPDLGACLPVNLPGG